jgi:methylmalonyl-CoA mutase
MLRATLAAFAAGVGGADAVTVLPFDAALGHPDELGRRIARNTHALLVDESSVARVIDPAGGSWYVESLTEAMAERAWEWFQAIEAGGGMAAALTAGLVSDRVAASRKARRAALARREEAITGVSEFPLLGEKLLTRAPDSFVEPGGGLPRIRWSQWHEQLRDRSDTFADSTGAPPTVALVSVGAAAASAQADRVGSVLAAAGVVVVPAAIGELTGQQLASPVAFVAAADGVAPAEVEAAAVALRAAGAEYVVLAGALPVAGTDECLEAGTDALALSSRVLDAIGVAP